MYEKFKKFISANVILFSFIGFISAYFVYDNYDIAGLMYNEPNSAYDAVLKLHGSKNEEGVVMSHGTAFHIGNGYVITAAHVIKTGFKEQIELKDRHGNLYEANVLWMNPLYDLAFLHISEINELKSINLSCQDANIGDNVKLIGNPQNLEFVTTWGRVSGKNYENPIWQDTFVLDMNIVPGQSGGAILDKDNNAVGVLVGVMIHYLNPRFGASLTNFGFAVSSSAVCKMLGK